MNKLNISKLYVRDHARLRANERFYGIDILDQLKTATLFGGQFGQSEAYLCDCGAVVIIENNELITTLTKQQYIANISRYHHRLIKIDTTVFLPPPVVPPQTTKPKKRRKKKLKYPWAIALKQKTPNAQKEKEAKEQETARLRRQARQDAHNQREAIQKANKEKAKANQLAAKERRRVAHLAQMELDRKRREEREAKKTKIQKRREKIHGELLALVQKHYEEDRIKRSITSYDVRRDELIALGYDGEDRKYYQELFNDYFYFHNFWGKRTTNTANNRKGS